MDSFRLTRATYFNFINIHLTQGRLHFLRSSLHGTDSDERVLDAFSGKIGLFHVEGLLHHHSALIFVHSLLLEDSQRLLLHGILLK